MPGERAKVLEMFEPGKVCHSPNEAPLLLARASLNLQP